MARKKSPIPTSVQISSSLGDFRPEDVPVTRSMLDHSNRELTFRMGVMQGELQTTIREMGTGIEAKFREMDTKFEAKFREMDTKFEAKFREMDTKFEAKFLDVDAKIDRVHGSLLGEIRMLSGEVGRISTDLTRVHAEVARIGVLVEEQNARNQVVLEGLSGLFKRQEKVETEVVDMRGFIQDLARALRKNGTSIPS